MATNTTSSKSAKKANSETNGKAGTTGRTGSTRSTSGSSRSNAADPLRILKADHREVERLLDRLSDSDEGSERQDALSELVTKLSLHMQIEEELVYPLVASEVGEDDEEEANIEHGLAREGLSKLESMVDAPGFGAAVEMLKGGIKHHVEEEEKELLPELRSALERDAWRELGEHILDAKSAAGIPAPKDTPRRSSKRASTRPS
jgi:hemerythrin-like domain-containing protein